MTLTELLNNIAYTKSQLKQKLGTSSDALDQYPTLITNFLYTQYNNGYKAGWKSIKGSDYSGNKKTLLTVSTTVPSWQGQDTTQLSTLVNVMSGIADIRVAMRNALGIASSNNTFSTYPSYLTVTTSHNSSSRADQEYQTGYAAGVQDANASTPLQSPTPIISVSGNTVRITCSSCNSLTWWITSSPTGAKVNASTQIGTNVTINITQDDSGKYVRAHSNTNGMNTSDYATSSQLVYTPEQPVVEPPAAPAFLPRVSDQNIIRVSSPSGTYIKYTINGGTSWNTILSNSGTIVIPTSGIAAQNLQAKCYWTNNTSVESELTIYQSALPYYDGSQPDEPVEDMSAVPFYIMTTNISGTYQLQATINRFHVSTKADFSELVLPAASSYGPDKWTLQPNTKYYICKHFNSTSLPKDGSLKLTNYTVGMYVNFGGNLLSLADFNWSSSSLTSFEDESFRSMFTDTNWKNSIKDISQLYFPLGGKYAYAEMFKGCQYITDGPSEISCGQTIKDHQFYGTFYGCKKLTNGAELTALTVETSGCEEMYYNCAALKTTGDISATTVGKASFKNMFYHCTSLTTGPSELKPYTLGQESYFQMFDTCSSLKEAPVINATNILGTNCMYCMFYYCTSLTYICVCFTDWPSSKTTLWVSGIPASTSNNPRVFEIQGIGTWKIEDHTGTSGIPDWLIDDGRDILEEEQR